MTCKTSFTALLLVASALAAPALASNISTGAAPWNVTVPGGAPQPAVVGTYQYWTQLPPAQWIGPPGGTVSGPPGDYTYTSDFTLAKRCLSPTIEGRFLGDNSVTVYLDSGPAIAVSGGTQHYGFLPGSLTGFGHPLTPGPHTLKVVVHNDDGPTGLVVQADYRCGGMAQGSHGVRPTR